MNIIEDWGSGIPRIRADIKDARLRDLEISAWPNAVRTVVYRHEGLKADIDGQEVDIGIPEVDIGSPKVDIGASKAAIESSKTDIECHLSGLTGKTRKHIETVLAHASGSLYLMKYENLVF